MEEHLQLDLAELLCARLCHDLAGPVGAVATGAELLVDEGVEASESLDLLAASAAAAIQRLRFFRLAFGPAAKPVAAADLRELASAFLIGSATAGGALTVDWRDGASGPWDAGPAKLLLNLLLVGRDCLPRGGRLRVSVRSSPGGMADLVAEGEGAAAADAAAGLIANGAGGLGPRGAQGFYAGRLAASLGVAVGVVPDRGSVALTARLEVRP